MKITGYGFAKDIYQYTTYPIGYFCMASDGQTHQDVRIFCTIYIVIPYLFIFILLWSTILHKNSGNSGRWRGAVVLSIISFTFYPLFFKLSPDSSGPMGVKLPHDFSR